MGRTVRRRDLVTAARAGVPQPSPSPQHEGRCDPEGWSRRLAGPPLDQSCQEAREQWGRSSRI